MDKSFIKDILHGLFMPLIGLLISFVILLVLNQIDWQINRKIEIDELVLSTIIFMLVALSEELFTRGYLLRNLLKSLNKWLALTMSSIVFGAFHLANLNMSLLSFLSLFLAGILLGIPYLYTRNLWFSIAFHFSWNFFQGTIFGFNVSGQSGYSLILQKRLENNIWNGGDLDLKVLY